MNELTLEDIKFVAELPFEWNKLSEKTLLISGGTGFIGSFICDVIRYRNAIYHQNIRVISVSFSPKKNDETVMYLKRDIRQPIDIEGPVDYILHLASNTHPEQYKIDPVGTITGNVFGTYNLLTLAKEKQSSRFVLASSCEIYGECKNKPIDELYSGYINSNTARAGYNEAKRVSESLCQSFFQQYGVESCIFRLARVFGPDNTKKDTKAMSQFMDNVINGEDIILKSKGFQKYSYVYISDAVSGIFLVLLRGLPGEAYNISAEYDGLCLKEYAEYIARLGGKKVVSDIENNPNASQAQNVILDCNKIKKLGYAPKYSVLEGLERTYFICKANKKE